MTRPRVLLVLLCFCVMGCASAPRLRGDDGSLYERVAPATATVLKDGRIAGAGAFVDADGLFLTAAHVVRKPADGIELLLPDGRTIPAEAIAVDRGHDLAILSTNGFRPDATLPLADRPSAPGEPIYLLAAPSMFVETWLPGRIARGRLSYNFVGGELDCYVESIVIAADPARGASGGCWVDERGDIVGVQSAFIGDDRGSLGLAFIGPAQAARHLIDRRRDRPTPTLAAQLEWLRTQARGYTGRFPPGTDGVAVQRIKPGGALDRAGVPRDHVITHLDAEPVTTLDALLSAVRRHAPGDRVELTVLAPDSHGSAVYLVELDELAWD